MNWQEVCADSHLQDLPYKIELNERGQVLMTPTKVAHGAYQSKISILIAELIQHTGKMVSECAIRTSKGTKVADVAWISLARWEQIKDEYDCSIAPEICVEILSPANSNVEIKEKMALYFEAGAKEVWLCDEEGNMRFYTSEGEQGNALLVPEFPKQIEI